MKSKNAFLRNLIIYGYVYDVNYDGLNKYNRELNAIGNNINQIVALCRKTGNVYPEDIKESAVIPEEYLSAAQTGFSYEHSPMENKKISGEGSSGRRFT